MTLTKFLQDLAAVIAEAYKEPKLKLNKGDKVELEIKTFLGIPYGKSIKIISENK